MPLFGEKKKSGKKGPAKDSAQGKVHLLLVEPCEHKEEEVPFGLITRKGEGDGKPQGLLTACAHLELSRYIIVRDAFFRILDSPSGAFEYCIHVRWFKSRKYGDDCWIKIPLPANQVTIGQLRDIVLNSSYGNYDQREFGLLNFYSVHDGIIDPIHYLTGEKVAYSGMFFGLATPWYCYEESAKFAH